jgi:rhamnulokinase
VTAVLAVDFGATSARVCRVDIGEGTPRVRVVHRVPHRAKQGADGSLRWDWPRLVGALEDGIVAGMADGPVASIGIDTWAVDYGLLDRRGDLIGAPFSYRDERTRDYRRVVDRIGEERLYELTGLQLQPFNTLFQLALHRRDELEAACHVLLLPELLVHHLTGELVAERTTAGSTALVDLRAASWSEELCEVAGIDVGMLPSIEPATTRVGTCQGVPVHLVGGHDTASAVVAMGPAPGPGTAFVATGTWLLVGREQSVPDTSARARMANFTNETGALGGYRFLRNLAGFWLLERCADAWGNPPIRELLEAAARIDGQTPTVDVTEERFLNPPDMVAALTSAAGLAADSPPPVVARCIVESMASTTASVLDHLGSVDDVRLIGGGVQAELLQRRLAEITGVSVLPGPVEAAALGNAMVQGIALGVYQDLEHARSALGGCGDGESTDDLSGQVSV